MDKQQMTESQRLTQRLLKTKRPEALALDLRVSVNTIYRWARGVTPQPGHVTRLRDYAAKQKQKAAAA